MRTNERAGQAAKYELQYLEKRLNNDTAHPDGPGALLDASERKETEIKISVLRRVCGIAED